MRADFSVTILLCSSFNVLICFSEMNIRSMSEEWTSICFSSFASSSSICFALEDKLFALSFFNASSFLSNSNSASCLAFETFLLESYL